MVERLDGRHAKLELVDADREWCKVTDSTTKASGYVQTAAVDGVVLGVRGGGWRSA